MKREAKRAQNIMEVGKRIRKRNQKALKVLLLLILVFIFTVMPAKTFYYIWLSIIYFESDELVLINWNWKFWIVIEYISYIYSTLNNVLNCVIYAKMMHDYRKFLKHIFTLGLLRRKTRSHAGENTCNVKTRQNVAFEMKEK